MCEFSAPITVQHMLGLFRAPDSDHVTVLISEFNPVQQPLLNEKVLRDKRKKLRETFERIVRLYERENPETYKELRKLEVDYETKRGQLSLYFDSVKVRVKDRHF